MSNLDDSKSLADLVSQNKKSKVRKVILSDSDDDLPLAMINTQASETSLSSEDEKAKQVKKRTKKESGGLPNKKAKTAVSKTEPKTKVKKETTKTAVKAVKAIKATKATKATKPTVKAAKHIQKIKDESKEQTAEPKDTSEEKEEEEENRWWEDEDMNGEIKWDSLVHNGVIFPPPYEPLPSNVKLIYDGKPVTLPIEAEEVAGFFGAMLETDHAKNPVFQKNFFHDFLKVLEEAGGCKDADIKDFDLCDFSDMYAYFEKKREEKKSISPAEKKLIKKEKDEAEEKFKTCYLNGRKEPVGNFRIEPPGLFRGRGAHPKTGKLKKRVMPEEIVLNLSADAPVPPPPEGRNWAEVRHDNKVAWLAMWRENISNSVKYVRFGNSSSLKGISDFKKFEKARELKNHVAAIRADYNKKLKSELMLERQMAVATYLIDVFALRAGGEKSDEEADTVGCCSLRFEHVFLKPPNVVVFDFLGKDSIRFYQEVEVDKQVFKNLKIFKKPPKQPGHDLFDRLDPSILNKHFQNYMPGLTAKVFRTYNASKTMQDQLDLIPNEGTVNEKVVRFNAANREVAILCNHQRTVSKNHETGVAKMNDKIKEMIWQRIRAKKMLLKLDAKLKKKDPAYFQEIDDLSKEDEGALQKQFLERETERITKKFAKDNEKLKLENEAVLPESELKERLEKVKELQKEFSKELSSGKPEVKANMTVEKLQALIEKLNVRITNATLQLKDKEDNSSVALGTSKMNYIDPRLTVMFSKKYDVPIEKLFTKTLREKFKWAIESADANWRF
ncbi:unnamed protein product [Kuraishia capsulata CBS 1993]|uniref:DNA topoisomerase I n=1 Tax=Kuraishia capsulata CBS 1993 TaxID=1382522 RepID=W6MJD9_9ASCO|nr:uncharacterized protein KUCA_T00002049001 [Kuraishia capsulata CBS 1993]CDK26078.1 unnamed protein product [Kuraishia capsulata CBS 1993]